MSYQYLACPYTHEDETVRLWRYMQANRAAYLLMKDGIRVFSPISHSHPIAEQAGTDVAVDADFWKHQDTPLLQHSDGLIVLALEGWKISEGIKWETDLALKLNLPIQYMYYLGGDRYVLAANPYMLDIRLKEECK